ncbi:hypothetical protein Asera_38560 [Actinocatenispora sera]|uniref:Uncharacterized protein n=1 Tax=Actinocatenispora sera TaxID=390989 RepID=A0A810L6L4_9ACTN|nr:hypothetical protein Asera_38560 [Actinocatenispora sera]
MLVHDPLVHERGAAGAQPPGASAWYERSVCNPLVHRPGTSGWCTTPWCTGAARRSVRNPWCTGLVRAVGARPGAPTPHEVGSQPPGASAGYVAAGPAQSRAGPSAVSVPRLAQAIASAGTGAGTPAAKSQNPSWCR